MGPIYTLSAGVAFVLSLFVPYPQSLFVQLFFSYLSLESFGIKIRSFCDVKICNYIVLAIF